ncbi:MAG: alpha/beta hydrolase [Aquisalinus sp.]|nr:alpha/beta hydrolase [Aquisalinus sp.]
MVIQLPLLLPAVGAAAWAVTRFHLKGEDLSQYDVSQPVTFEADPDSDGVREVNAYLLENYVKPAKAGSGSRADQLKARRARMDNIGLTREFPKEISFKPDKLMSGDVEVTGEWTRAKGANPDRRLLYIHGGAGTVGSAISHRGITSNLALRTKASIFAVNYRLMPENPRMASVQDVRAAYRWIIDNGPDGPATTERLAVAGDSAGGNLTLSLINWVRDTGLWPADAVIAISPAVDSTFSSPSLRSNFKTDLMLQTLFQRFHKVPRTALLWGFWGLYRLSPSEPEISPIFADLSGLPPTLVHVSSEEMLYDDARRYVAKAQSQGSPATLQSWSHMPHVWHAFDRMLPEAGDAFDEIAAFLKSNNFMRKA